ncbi:MAG: LysR family transcriptional regulator [Comamonadaceae bacterium]|nr:LysR family transcriptional regulator [Comamonadaceae bacterium]
MNFKHLHYFWVAARAGGVVKAGEQLHTTPQTLSAQIKLLEDRLGRRLFRKSGRRLELTDDGRVALRYADEIFALGNALEAALRETGDADGAKVLDFRVGVADSVAKSVACHLLEPALELDRAGADGLPRRQARRPCWRGWRCTELDLVHRRRAAAAPRQRQGLQPRAGQQSPMSFFCRAGAAATLQGDVPALPGRRADAGARRGVAAAPAARGLADAARRGSRASSASSTTAR